MGESQFSSFAILAILVSVLYFSHCFCNKIECVNLPKDPCVCKFSNGSVINLRTVGLQNKPKFQDIKSTNDSYLYSYNPCFGFTEGSAGSGCSTPVAACQSSSDKTEYFNIGIQNSPVFYYNGSNFIIQYTSGQTPERVTNVTLKCSSATTLTVFGETGTDTRKYVMTLESPCACLDGCVEEPHSSGLSTGSILVLLLFVLVFFYILGGILFKKIVVGATGYEVIPHYEFWLEFPLLVRDGCIFCYSGCNTSARVSNTTYDRI